MKIDSCFLYHERSVLYDDKHKEVIMEQKLMKNLALLMIVISGVLYQICSKTINSELNPFIPLLVTYAIAFFTTLLLCICTANISSLFSDIKKINFFSYLLGIVICFYEVGFILAYRNGFGFTTLPPLANILVIVTISIVGVFLYGEQITLLKASGLLLAVIGIALSLI